MQKGEIIVFTSGAGQYYCIEAVARVERDFTDEENRSYYAFNGARSSPYVVQGHVKNLVDKGFIKLVIGTEFNLDKTRNKTLVHPLVNKSIDKIYATETSDIQHEDEVLDADHESGPPGFRREIHKRNSRLLRQRLCGVDVDHVNKAVTLIFTNGPDIKIEGVDFLRDDNIQALRNLIAIVCPERM